MEEKRKKVRMYLLTTVYALVAVGFLLTTYLLTISLKNAFTLAEDDLTYVSYEILNNSAPVMNTKDIVIGKPYNSSKVSIYKNYYNYSDKKEDQEKSIIYYEHTYIQNSGVDYIANEEFDVISILDGTVIAIENSELLGNTIKVKHDKDLISIYQSVEDINVEVDQKIIKGYRIGKSGKSLLNSDLNHYLHFELTYQGKIVDPLDFYNKKITDL